MYCINCGVALEDTEKVCPLCNTKVYHPDITRPSAEPLYPLDKYPKAKSARKALSGGLIIVFAIPLVLGLFSDFMTGGNLSWSLVMAASLVLSYIYFALPLWFKKANPVIFIPCDIAATILFLHYINFYVGGDWFWTFALPVTVGFGLVLSALVTLFRYVKRGKLYMLGGSFIAFGGMVFLVEILLDFTFGVDFLGWSIYPMSVLLLCGGLLIYLAINSAAREAVARKLFF